MKIAIPTQNNIVDDHFGNCESYTIYTIDKSSSSILDKEILPSPKGCGCKSNIAETLHNKNVEIMLAGNMGNGALEKLSEKNIQVIRGCKGDIETLILEYIKGNIIDSKIACNHHEDGHVCTH